MYCERIAPGEESRTCREAGARMVFEKKFKTRTPEERIYRADGQDGRYPAFIYTGNCGLGFDYFLSRRVGDHFGNITARELGSSKL